MVFECKDVTLGYENVVVARNLNFTINKGDYLCIVGENGTGKSTLIKTMLGLVKPLDGKVINYKSGKNVKSVKGIGYVPQQTETQKDFPASVWEVVLSGTLNAKSKLTFYSKADKEEAERNMKKLGIFELKKKCYRELSGGQQQRVLLARALCSMDSILILDEPVTGLDPAAVREFYGTVKELNEKEEVTVVMVTHDINSAMDYASHILHMNHKGFFFGTKEEYHKSKVSNMFLGGDGNGNN